MTEDELIAVIQDHHDRTWGTRTVESEADRALYRTAGIPFGDLRPWQQGDVDYNEIRKRGDIANGRK